MSFINFDEDNFHNKTNNEQLVNWFPGHMHKSFEKLKGLLKDIDLIIEIADARAPISSINNEMKIFFKDKLILTFFLKKDLAINNLILNNAYSVFDKKIKEKIVNEIQKKLEFKINKLKNKGLVNPIIQVLVCGLPNTGKSTIINILTKKKVAQTADSPGWTKAFSRFEFHTNMWVYDTPGIFYKNVLTNELGYKLALIGCIKREVLPIDDVIEFAYQYLLKKFPKLLEKLVDKKIFYQLEDFLLLLAKKRNFLLLNNVWDLKKATWYFYDQIRTGEIGPINWDLI